MDERVEQAKAYLVFGERCEYYDDAGVCGRTIEEEQANARLIAAAPELLAEMKRYLPILESVFSDGNALHHHGWGTGLATLNGYVAAIAKAEGE